MTIINYWKKLAVLTKWALNEVNMEEDGGDFLIGEPRKRRKSLIY